MIIPVDGDFRLGSDDRCWRVERRIHRRAGDTWEPISWHPSLQEAVQSLAERMIWTSDAEGLTEALEEVNRVTTRLTLALSPTFRVEVRR